LIVRTLHHSELHRLLDQGLPVSAVARQLSLDRKTVRRFSDAEAAELLVRGRQRCSAVDVYQPHLARRWREGQHVAKVLFEEIRGLGYGGSVRTVARYVAGVIAIG
jgi:transposase